MLMLTHRTPSTMPGTQRVLKSKHEIRDGWRREKASFVLANIAVLQEDLRAHWNAPCPGSLRRCTRQGPFPGPRSSKVEKLDKRRSQLISFTAKKHRYLLAGSRIIPSPLHPTQEQEAQAANASLQPGTE